MKTFEHINPASIDDAAALLAAHPGQGALIAGGTDLLGGLKDDIWINRPQYVINLKSIAGLDYIAESPDGIRIGPLATLSAIAGSELIQRDYTALAEAARRTASPLLRNLGTIGGNICQENRCWYYRYPGSLGGRFDCVRKGGKKCFAVAGDHRYHSIFGAVNKCVAVNPSDTAPALVALGAVIQTTARAIAAEDFFSAKNGARSTVLADDEIVTEIRVPRPGPGATSAFKKIALRQTIDFAIVNCAAVVTRGDEKSAGAKITSARICLNGVYLTPYRALQGEEALINATPSREAAEAAGAAALSTAKPLKGNQYKAAMAQAITTDTVMACLGE